MDKVSEKIVSTRNMNDLKEEYGPILYKICVFVFYIIVGLMGKISSMLFSGRRMTWYQILGSLGIALFIGAMASSLCIYNGWENQAKIIVPLATYMSEKLSLILMQLNYKQFVKDLLDSVKKHLGN